MKLRIVVCAVSLLWSSWSLTTTTASLTTTISRATLSSRSDCYVFHENFVFTYNITKPQAGDLIGVTRIGSGMVVLAVPVCWQTSCLVPPSFGTRTIRESLSLGVYKAYLVRSNKRIVFASSAPFRLQHSCVPTASPSMTTIPTGAETNQPTQVPTVHPSIEPTTGPIYAKPSSLPTQTPTRLPSKQPTPLPTPLASQTPTPRPTALPSTLPSTKPTTHPSEQPTKLPTFRPSPAPSPTPTIRPTPTPSQLPTNTPTTSLPTEQPTALPTFLPTEQPTTLPTFRPTEQPTLLPTEQPTTPPTILPTEQPTTLPTYLPTIQPTQLPTLLPTAEVTSRPTSRQKIAYEALTQAKEAIADMVRQDSRLTPELLRLGFHDCITVCDGCIDLTNPDNSGLSRPISLLDPVVEQYANASTGLSRADIWALAVTVSADVADHGDIKQPINFTMPWYGRVDCEDAVSVCHNRFGEVTPCSKTFGPSRHMASPNLNSETIFSYFDKEFGFNKRQTITIMGVHTVGHLVRQESGIDGPNGWTFNNVKLHNEYYQALMGQADINSPDSDVTKFSPKWRRTYTNNSGTDFPDRFTWGLSLGGKPLVMLNSDVSFVRHINASNQNPVTGEVLCAYNERTANGSAVCPVASTVRIVAEFAADNDHWLSEFKNTLDLMLTNGYARDPVCSDGACQLSMIPGINNQVNSSEP